MIFERFCFKFCLKHIGVYLSNITVAHMVNNSRVRSKNFIKLSILFKFLFKIQMYFFVNCITKFDYIIPASE